MGGNLEPFSPLYIGRAAVHATLQERYAEAARQRYYWIHEYADHGDSVARDAYHAADKLAAEANRALEQFEAYAHCYPVESNFDVA